MQATMIAECDGRTGDKEQTALSIFSLIAGARSPGNQRLESAEAVELRRLMVCLGRKYGATVRLSGEAQPLGGYARHYYDLFQLAAEPEVLAMLQSAEYAAIKADYDAISRTHFPKSYFYPEEMSFARSDALFPPDDLAAAIRAEYESQCRLLCYGLFPNWPEVQARLRDLKHLL
jgi:hypothetical protein